MEETKKEFARKWFKLGYNDCVRYFITTKPNEEGIVDYPANINDKFEEWYINMEAMEKEREESLKGHK